MEDLSAASLEDVVEFFKTYYAPNNASLVVAGDIDSGRRRTLVEKWFGDVPRGQADVPPLVPRAGLLSEVKRKTITDRVQLPRLYLAWHTPASTRPATPRWTWSRALLTGGKNSRLYRRLVYEMQMAQDVRAAESQALGSAFWSRPRRGPGRRSRSCRR